ncbi:MAG: hypothetical protein COA47_05920 [Robiginitomaculum sp.]|nr:MAG: hypothetical protein COA47_05920 [Robiginitomaculum sp.]
MTKIQWTDDTWNPIVGCSIVSPGCTNCYAMKAAWRMGHNPLTPQYAGLTKKVNGNAVWTGKMALAEKALLKPLRRQKPTMYFVNSMGDLFHENVPDEWIDQVFAVMALCPQHTFQVLTKRADRMREYFAGDRQNIIAWKPVAEILNRWFPSWRGEFSDGPHRSRGIKAGAIWPLPNVWLGVSVEDQPRADERIPLLLDTPAAVRFVSAEPLLAKIDISKWLHNPACRAFNPDICTCYTEDRTRLNWVICGGESGKDARAMHPDWARSLRDLCQDAGVPFFFKQWGEWVPASHIPPELDVDDLDLGEFHDGCNFILGCDCSAGDKGSLMFKIGKKDEFNLLDGRVWADMPEVAA